MVVALIVRLPESVRFLIAHGAKTDRVAPLMARIAPGFTDVNRVRFVPGATPLKGLSVKHLFSEGRALGTIMLWIPYLMNLLIIYFIISWLPAVLRQAGMPISAGVEAISLFSFGGIVGSLLQGFAMHKLGSSRVLAVEFGISVLLIGSSACCRTL